MYVEQKSILLWLRDTIPSIRGKVFAMADIPLEFDSEHSEMIHTYLEYKIDILPTQEEIKQFINEHHGVWKLRIYHSYKGNLKGIDCTHKTNNRERPIESENVIYKNGNFRSNTGRWDDEVYMDNVFLTPYNTLEYFEYKSMYNNGWYKKYNPNYVLEMTIRYLNSVLDNMELCMKIAYLRKSLGHMWLYSYYDIENLLYERLFIKIGHMNNIKAIDEHYHLLYNVVISFIHDRISDHIIILR